MRKINFKLFGLMLAIAVAMPIAAFAQSTNSTATTPQVPQPSSGGVDWNGVGIGAATLGANVLYIPAKFVYGILGGITGGAGWAVTGGNSQVSDTIWRSSLGGDYVLTPSMIRGDDPIHFSGPTNTAPSGSAASAPISTAPSGANNGTTSAAPASSGYSSSAGSAPMSVVPSNSSAAGQPIDNGGGPVRGATAQTAPHERDFE